jgi:hypothetical protein
MAPDCCENVVEQSMTSARPNFGEPHHEFQLLPKPIHPAQLLKQLLPHHVAVCLRANPAVRGASSKLFSRAPREKSLLRAGFTDHSDSNHMQVAVSLFAGCLLYLPFLCRFLICIHSGCGR